MTIEELKQRLSAVFKALDGVQVSGYYNVKSQAASMAIIDEILRADIVPGDQKDQ